MGKSNRVGCRLVIGFSFFLAAQTSCAAAEPPQKMYTIAPAESWVNASEVPDRSFLPAEQISGGVYCIQADEQVKVDEKYIYSYNLLKGKPVNAGGVHNMGHIDIEFDPDWESVVVHQVSIVRQKERIDALKDNNIHILRREDRLDDEILNGLTSLTIVLKDLRVNDIVEYSYTIRKDSSVFNGRFVDSFPMNWSSPGQSRSYRLLLPKGRNISIYYTRKSYTPLIRDQGPYVEYTWRAENILPVKDEDDLPRWFRSEDQVQISEFPSWSSLNSVLSKEYAARIAYSDPLDKKIREIVEKYPGDAERVVEALHFVQEEIRYTGMEMGVGAYLPRPPPETFEKRYGDCKDKSLLFVAMLRKMNIEAYPALVNLDLRSHLTEYLPAQFMFSHVVTKVILNGQIYWLDPTQRYQSDSLETIYQPQVGAALVLDGSPNGLVSLLVRPLSTPAQSVKEDVYFDKSPAHSARIVIATTYSAFMADEMRETVQSTGAKELQENYYNYWVKHYPSFRVEKPLEVADDKKANQLVIRESYVINDPWNLKDKSRDNEFMIAADAIMEYYHKPDIVVRENPLAVSFPVNVAYEINLHMPGPWKADTGKFHLHDPAFAFSRRVSQRGSLIQVKMDYLTLADHVDPSQLADYLKHMEKLWDHLDYTIELSDRNPVNWAGIGVAVLFILVVAGGIFLYKVRRKIVPACAGRLGTVLIWCTGLYLMLWGLIMSLMLCGVVFAFASQKALLENVPTLVFMAALMLWFLAAGTGVLLRKNWARVSLLVMSVIAIIYGVTVWMFMSWSSVLLPFGDVPSEIKGGILSVTTLIFIVIPAISLFFFDNSPMAERYGVASGAHAHRPVGIMALSSWMVVSGIISIIYAFFTRMSEMPVAGDIWISGIYLRIYLIATGLLLLILGAGLWKMKGWAWKGTLGVHGVWALFSYLQMISMTKTKVVRMLEATKMLVTEDFVLLCKWASGVGMIVGLALILYLWIVRRKFLSPPSPVSEDGREKGSSGETGGSIVSSNQ